jgi:gas vesicle protein
MTQFTGETREGKSEMSEGASQIKGDMKRLKEDLAMLRSDLGDITKSIVKSGKESAQTATDRVKDEITTHPGISLAAAFGLGFLVAKILD